MARIAGIKPRRGTTAEWAAANAASPSRKLDSGELGYDSTTKDLVVGDGTTAFASLPRVGSGTYAPLAGQAFADPARADGVTDNLAYLQGLLDTSGVTSLRIPKGAGGAQWTLSGPLVLSSGQTVDATGAAFGLTQATQFITNDARVTAVASTRDTNITWRGGTLNRGALGGTNLATMNTIFAFVDGLVVEGLTVNSTGGKYAVYLLNCNNFKVQDITVTTVSDGVHLNGGCAHGVIRRVSGTTGDDMVAIMPRDAAAWEIAGQGFGDLSNILIENVSGTSLKSLVKVLGGQSDDTLTQYAARRITIRQVDGNAGLSSTADCTAVWLGGDITHQPGLVGGLLDNIKIEQVRNTLTTQRDAIKVWHGATVRGLDVSGVAAGDGAAVYVGDVTLDSLTVRDCTFAPSKSSPLVRVGSTATVGAVFVRGINLVGTGSTALVKSKAGATLGSVHVDGVRTAGGWAVADLATTTKLFVNGVNSSTQKGFVRVAYPGAVTVHGAAGLATAGTDGMRVSGGTLAVRDLGARVDVSTLRAPSAGDLAYNTNAALSCGAGPVACNGTLWKHLYTGSTVAVTAALVPSATAYKTAALADSPIALWMLDEASGNAVDATAGAHTGTPTGSITRSRAAAGPGTGAMTQFNGGYFTADALGTFGAGMGSGFTVEFLIRTTAATRGAVLGATNTGSTMALGVYLRNMFTQGGGNTGSTNTTSTTLWLRNASGTQIGYTIWDDIYDGLIHHLVMTMNPGTGAVTAYVDGQEAQYVSTPAAAIAGTYANWGFPMVLGANNGRGTIDTFVGTATDLAAVAFYASVLTETQAEAHFAALAG